MISDLAQIRALIESTNTLNNNSTSCPCCEMPFDKGKKRRLIDSCGHERCYSCLIRSENCPLCIREQQRHLDDLGQNDDDEEDFQIEHRKTSSSAYFLGWLEKSASPSNSICDSPRPRLRNLFKKGSSDEVCE